MSSPGGRQDRSGSRRAVQRPQGSRQLTGGEGHGRQQEAGWEG